MLGLSFFEDDLKRDAQTWAERLLMRLDEARQDPVCAPVVQALERLTVSPDIADFSVSGAPRPFFLFATGCDSRF